MGMGMGVSFQYPMGMGTGIGVIFENGYECGYSSTRSEPALLPFLLEVRTLARILHATPTKLTGLKFMMSYAPITLGIMLINLNKDQEFFDSLENKNEKKVGFLVSRIRKSILLVVWWNTWMERN